MAVHFVGFTESAQYWRATQVFGKPDYIHRFWDKRAKHGGEVDVDDVFVFATGDETKDPVKYTFDDSAVF
jgi:hypothetical protein